MNSIWLSPPGLLLAAILALCVGIAAFSGLFDLFIWCLRVITHKPYGLASRSTTRYLFLGCWCLLCASIMIWILARSVADPPWYFWPVPVAAAIPNLIIDFLNK